MTSVNCRLAAPWVTALGSGDDVRFGLARNHIDSCLYCQASIARQRRVRRSLEGLASVSESAPSDNVLFASGTRVRSGRSVVVGAIGAALAIGIGVAGLRKTLVP